MVLASLQLIQKSTEIGKFLFFHFRITAFISSFSCSNNRAEKLFPAKMDTFSKFKLYRNLEEILEELSKHDHQPKVQKLLGVYNQAKILADEQKQDAKHPFIVLEGLDGSGKTAMSRKLAKKAQAERWVTPPESIRILRTDFDSDHLRTAYYSLGNYIAALEVSCILSEKPVVMDRYWHSTTAYALAQMVVSNPNELELPSESDDIYKWPTDLLKPDKVILLSVSEEVRLERHSRRKEELVTEQEKLLKNNTKFRENVIHAYQSIPDPKVTIVDGDGSFGRTLHFLWSNVEPLLN